MERRIKLLIVDDETEILAAYKSFFQKRNFEVDVAVNGEEGLKKLRNGEFDVSILDILMPKMDGITLAQHIIDEGIDTSIIILTGHGDKEQAVKAINLGGVGAWFEKATIDMDTLLHKVKSLAEIIPLSDVQRILSGVPVEEILECSNE